MDKPDRAAFPWTKFTQHKLDPKKIHRQDFSGMSLREYYAGQALVGLCANPDFTAASVEVLVQKAKDFADGMFNAMEGGAQDDE